MIKALFFVLAALIGFSTANAENPASSFSRESNENSPVKRIDIFVLPYYQSSTSSNDHPKVHVAKNFDERLSSDRLEDILAVRDEIELQPGLITPMTLMVLAIRLYDVGLRNDAVFWFYVAKDRYITLSEVVDMRSSGLLGVEDSIGNFAGLAGQFVNSYAFCNLESQRLAKARAITWVEQNPYGVIFDEQFHSLPGDRASNLKKSIAKLRQLAENEQKYFDDPKNVEEFQKRRKEGHVNEKFCWAN